MGTVLRFALFIECSHGIPVAVCLGLRFELWYILKGIWQQMNVRLVSGGGIQKKEIPPRPSFSS